MNTIKNKKTFILSSIALLVLFVAGITYAFFTAIVSNGDKGSSIIIETGTLRLRYSDGQYINQTSGQPGDVYSKVVTVTNEGNLAVSYDMVWINLVNSLVTKDDMVMSITCTSSTDSCTGYQEATVSNSGTNIPLMNGIEIDGQEIHTYVVTITFKETGSDQNDNQGKGINGKIGIISSGTFTTDVYGYIFDENSSVMPNVIVELHSDPKSVLTDANGYYVLPDVVIGNHTMNVKTSDGTSIIMTTGLNINYSSLSSINGTNVSIDFDITSVGLNIIKNASTPIVRQANILKGTSGNNSYSNEYYAYKSSITSIAIENDINIPIDVSSSWDVSIDQNSTVMAYIKSDGSSGYELHIQARGEVYAPENSSYLFYGFNSTEINLANLDTSGATNMSYMFGGSNMSVLDLSTFNTSNVTNMSYMFRYCNNLSTLNISTFNTSKVTNMSGMFDSNRKIASLNLSSFDTSNVTEMSSMFYGCNILDNLDLSNFNTSKVTTMVAMFEHCEAMKNLNVSSFNTTNVRDVQYMFEYTGFVNLDISSFDINKTRNTSYMLADMPNLVSIDFSGSSFTSPNEADNTIISNLPANTTIYVKDLAAKVFITRKMSTYNYDTSTRVPYGTVIISN